MMKIGFGYDSHRLGENRSLTIGGVLIPYEKGLIGHSDADVLVHAVCDAFLGAMGQGDIGCHFPDTDPAYKDASSLFFLERIASMMGEKNYRLSHLDSSIIIEKPKMRPYIRAMQQNLADTLRVDAAKINIKAKTNEGMGFIGRQEGAAAFAVVVLEEKPKT